MIKTVFDKPYAMQRWHFLHTQSCGTPDDKKCTWEWRKWKQSSKKHVSFPSRFSSFLFFFFLGDAAAKSCLSEGNPDWRRLWQRKKDNFIREWRKEGERIKEEDRAAAREVVQNVLLFIFIVYLLFLNLSISLIIFTLDLLRHHFSFALPLSYLFLIFFLNNKVEKNKQMESQQKVGTVARWCFFLHVAAVCDEELCFILQPGWVTVEKTQ